MSDQVVEKSMIDLNGKRGKKDNKMAKLPGYIKTKDWIVEPEKHVVNLTIIINRRHPQFMLLMARTLWRRVEITDRRTGRPISKWRPWFLRRFVVLWWKAIFGPL